MSNEGKRKPSIPEVRVADPAAQRVLEALKSSAETDAGLNDPLDKTVTIRDLTALGLAEAIVQRNGRNVVAQILPTVTGREDADYASIPPPEPIGAYAVGGFNNIMVTWTAPNYANHSHTEIWRYATDAGDPAPAFDPEVFARVGMSSGAPFVDTPPNAVSPQDYHYWLRNVSTSGLFSGLVGPFTAQLATDPAYIIDVLLGETSPFNEGDPLLIEVPAATTVNGQYVPAGIYIRDLFVQNGTITDAKIGYAQIRDAHIVNVTADKILTGELQATRHITVNGDLRGGKTGYNSAASGFWIGRDSGMYKFHIGSTNYYMKWTGTELLVSSKITASEIEASTITGSQFVVDGAGAVRGGKANYADTVPGFWLGQDTLDDEFKFHIGDSLNYMRWDGAQLVVQGRVETSVLDANVITGSTLDNTNTLIAPTYILDPDRVPGLGGGMLVAAAGQPLDDPENAPERLCYPALLRDSTAAPINSGVATTQHLLPGGTAAPTLELFYGPTVSGFTTTTRWRRLESADAQPFSYKLHPAAADVESLSRAANTTARVRVRISDLAVYDAIAHDGTGSDLPPHWAGGADGSTSMRVMKIVVTQKASGYVNELATLDLSSDCRGVTPVQPTVGSAFTTEYNPSDSSLTVRQSALWRDGPEVGAGTTTQDDWEIVYSYGGAGGEIAIVAEKDITFQPAASFFGPAPEEYLGLRVYVYANDQYAVLNGLNTPYTWVALQVTLEVLADNRPFVMDEIEAP